MNNTKISIAPDGKKYAIPSERSIQDAYEGIVKRAQWHRSHGRKIVVVQGLGFVGAAVAAVVAAAKKKEENELCYFVIGVDLSTEAGYWKVAKINEGQTPVVSTDAELEKITKQQACEQGNLCATVCEKAYALADVIIVDVHLDVRTRVPENTRDISINAEGFKEAIRTIGRYMAEQALVIVETTVPIGTCEHIALPILTEERAKRNITAAPMIAHAYERVMPGPHYVHSIRNYWRAFSGIDRISAAKTRDFLESFINTTEYPLVQLGDTVSSEMAKLLENSYRAYNIAFIYEWTLLAERAGVNLFDVVEAIRMRRGTHDNMRYPGFGVGGYCLTKDSLLAQWSSNNLFGAEVDLALTLQAITTNFYMPRHTKELLLELCDGTIKDKTIAVCGVSYLPDVADTRNSPTDMFVAELEGEKAKVIVHDPVVSFWAERPTVTVTQDLQAALCNADAVVFAVAHREYGELSPQILLDWASRPLAVIDGQNVINDEKAEILNNAGCRVAGVGKGHWRKRGYQCRQQQKEK